MPDAENRAYVQLVDSRDQEDRGAPKTKKDTPTGIRDTDVGLVARRNYPRQRGLELSEYVVGSHRGIRIRK